MSNSIVKNKAVQWALPWKLVLKWRMVGTKRREGFVLNPWRFWRSKIFLLPSRDLFEPNCTQLTRPYLMNPAVCFGSENLWHIWNISMWMLKNPVLQSEACKISVSDKKKLRYIWECQSFFLPKHTARFMRSGGVGWVQFFSTMFFFKRRHNLLNHQKRHEMVKIGSPYPSSQWWQYFETKTHLNERSPRKFYKFSSFFVFRSFELRKWGFCVIS